MYIYICIYGKNKSRPEAEKIKKSIPKIFRENKLDIVIQSNMTEINYLDVSLNLFKIIQIISVTINLITKYYISINIQTTHPASLDNKKETGYLIEI